MSIGEIKKDAKSFLKDNYWKTVGLYILYLITTVVIGIVLYILEYLETSDSDGMAMIASTAGIVIQICIIVPIMYGFVSNLVALKKKETTKISEFIVRGFSDFKRAISVWWSIYWRKLLKTLPGMIVMIIGAFFVAYGLLMGFMALIYYSSDDLAVYGVAIVLGLIAMLIGYLLALPFILEYVLYNIIAVDRPELSGKEVAKECLRVMKGNRCKYIGFWFSFIGWWLLCSMTCGIGFIFVNPYYHTAKVSFYESIAKKDENEVIEENNTDPIIAQ